MAEAKTNPVKGKPQKEEKKVNFILPLIPGEDDEEVVWINERRWVIKRGEYVEMPECVAKVLMQSQKELQIAKKKQEKLKEQVTNM